MADDDHRIPECDDCDDDSGWCDNPVLDEGRYFSLALRWGFENLTRIPCYARLHVCDFVQVNDWHENEMKEVKLKTKHGFVLKAYAFEEDMQITFDLGRRRRGTGIFLNEDIWVLVGDMIPVLPPSYGLATSDQRKTINNTYYNHGLELTMEEKYVFINVVRNLHLGVVIFQAGASYTPYVPFVLQLTDAQINAISLRLLNDVVSRWMADRGEITIVCAEPWGEPFKHDYSTESGRNGCLRVKGWRKMVVQRKPKAGDKLFVILHNGEGGVFLFYFLLPLREE